MYGTEPCVREIALNVSFPPTSLFSRLTELVVINHQWERHSLFSYVTFACDSSKTRGPDEFRPCYYSPLPHSSQVSYKNLIVNSTNLCRPFSLANVLETLLRLPFLRVTCWCSMVGLNKICPSIKRQ